jgi:hypothetical protein
VSTRAYAGTCDAKDAVWSKTVAPFVDGNGLVVAIASPELGDFFRCIDAGIDTRKRLYLVDNEDVAATKAIALKLAGAIAGARQNDIAVVVQDLAKSGRKIDIVLADFCGPVDTIGPICRNLYRSIKRGTRLVVTGLGSRDSVGRGNQVKKLTTNQRGARRACRTQRMNAYVGAKATETFYYTGSNGSAMVVWEYEK